MSEQAAKSSSIDVGPYDSKRRVIIFHGYSGSPDEFRLLASDLSERLDARVSVPLLPGHGQDEHDLLALTFDDFLEFAKQTVAEATKKGEELILMGHSFGGYLALLVSQEVQPKAMILSVIPYSLRTRFWLPWAAWLMRTRAFWKKKLSAEELEYRKGIFFYKNMPGIALTLVKDGIARINAMLSNANWPILTIHNDKDPISTPKSGGKLLEKSANNPLNKHIVLHNNSHGVFYGPHKKEAEASVIEFLENIFKSKNV